MVYNWERKDSFYYLAGLEKEVTIAFSTRNFYCGFKEDLDFMGSERVRFLKNFKLKAEDMICPNQTHEAVVFEALDSDRGKGAFCRDETLNDIDALVTKERNLALTVLTADCNSLFLYDKKNRSIGLAHLGWRGLAKGLHLAVIQRMKNLYNSNPQDLVAALGPGIRSCCYEVGDPLTRYFKKYLFKKNNKDYLDLPDFLKGQLKENGILEKNITDCLLCTSCKNEELFSFRKEGEQADRIMSVIALK